MNPLLSMNHPLAGLNGMVVGLPPAEMLQLRAALGIPTIGQYQELARRMQSRSLAAADKPAAAAKVVVRYLPDCINGLAVHFNSPIFSYRRGSQSRDLPLVLAPGCFGSLEGQDVF